MNKKVTLDRAGRLVLPKKLRDQLRLAPGDALDVSVQGEQVMLRPVRGASPLQKENGVWVLRTGKPLTGADTQRVLHELRSQRERLNLGQKR